MSAISYITIHLLRHIPLDIILPLVVTDVPGNEDVVRDTNAGVIVRSKVPEQMAQGLSDLVNDAGRREALSEIAIARAVDYDWRTVAGRYVGVYRNVLAGRTAAFGLESM